MASPPLMAPAVGRRHRGATLPTARARTSASAVPRLSLRPSAMNDPLAERAGAAAHAAEDTRSPQHEVPAGRHSHAPSLSASPGRLPSSRRVNVTPSPDVHDDSPDRVSFQVPSPCLHPVLSGQVRYSDTPRQQLSDRGAKPTPVRIDTSLLSIRHGGDLGFATTSRTKRQR